MQSSLDKLRKFFRLERENGYTNTAVIGGLANVLAMWEGEARNDKLPEEIVQATSATLRAYADKTPDERVASLKALWKQISDRIPEAALVKKPAPVKPVPIVEKPIPTPVPQQMQPAPSESQSAALSAPAEQQTVPEPEVPPQAPVEPVALLTDGITGSGSQGFNRSSNH
jgi:ATP-dependent DNA helicase RecG